MVVGTYLFKFHILFTAKLEENVKLAEIFTFKTIFGTGNRIFGKNTSEMVYFKKCKIIFFGHFLTKKHIFAINRHLKMVES